VVCIWINLVAAQAVLYTPTPSRKEGVTTPRFAKLGFGGWWWINIYSLVDGVNNLPVWRPPEQRRNSFFALALDFL